MRQRLVRHPDTPCDAVTEIGVEIARIAPTVLKLTYMVQGEIARLAIPAAAGAARTDELWRHTCFEAFAKPAGGEGYLEFNFAPSGQWAAYRFDGYRQGMRLAEDVVLPNVAVRRGPGWLEIAALADVGEGPVRLGLSAVIEAADGRKSYWALRHPPEKPDFHHPDCFALEIPAPLAS
ncbi:DOMON-like domain-containing protein [Phenylobacterium soli]|uniref:DOMON-like domain-containing protein n=1 Tax=Phenylobacterium soli TaxID=2170551 RepID=A0A328AMJ4_9CAUL|nr:DOMON-like domain-containing protein [Phenylobacterium soli]RAK56192.1 hypothetical protein DJ017_02825 [Phenylobacterium soli]